nr:unnamed protein product [Callosobruchus chinensis]
MFEDLKRKIQDFFEFEDVSRVCPGKKEYVSRNKVQKQKRYLSNTLKNLYLQFVKKYPAYKIGYSFFCKNRPFWVKTMKIAERDTCKCIQCTNMELVVKSLNSNKVLLGKTPCDVIQDMCCNSNLEECLLRTCQNCISSRPQINEFQKDDIVQYHQWVSLKSKFYDTLAELLKIFDAKILLWMSHQARVFHQHSTMTYLKENLKESEIVVHCDFSENYLLKYAEETQSFHFGGSIKQISIHTVVVYTKVGGKTVPKSYCTLSDSLNHGPAAIWAHLTPILNEYLNDGIILNIHFLSDSPATQYRNKHMFSYLTNQLFTTYPNLKCAVWNFHESGHGKGAPDGLGGLCKRKGDEAVAHGKDVPDLESFYDVVKEKCPGIQLHIIFSEQIEEHERLLSSLPIQLFKGTMKAHQVVTHNHPLIKKLWIRSLSCYACSKFCCHYELGTLEYTLSQFTSPPSVSSDSSYDSEDNLPLSCMVKPLSCINVTKNKQNKLNVDDVYSDEDMPGSSSLTATGVQSGTYVLVSMESMKNINYRYVAVCTSNMEDGEVQVSFLRVCSGENICLFKLESDDSSYIKHDQILEILPEPSLVLKGNRIYYKFKSRINVFESA